jgi:hypothetical protein
VSEVSPGHLKFKFQRLLKKFFIGPQPTNFMVHPIVFVCLLFVLTRPGRDAYPIYFLDPLPDCIISTECYMSIDFHRPRASCWVWTRTIEGSHKVTRRPSTSRPPGPHLSSQPATYSIDTLICLLRERLREFNY